MKYVEVPVTFDEAIRAWKENRRKFVCFKYNGEDYALNAPYSEKNLNEITKDQRERGQFYIMGEVKE